MGGLSKFWETREEKMRADATFYNNYAITGRYIFEILYGLNRPYLDSVEDFADVASLLYMSTYKQFVYSLKLARGMTSEEVNALAHTIRRELAKKYNISVEEFAKNWTVKIIGNNIFIAVL